MLEEIGADIGLKSIALRDKTLLKSIEKIVYNNVGLLYIPSE